MVGNLFNELLRGGNQNSNNKVEISNILPSQYTKAEINYIKHILLNNGDIFAFRAFTGIAIPYGNSNYIPCLLYTSPSPRDRTRSRMPSSA